MDTILVANAGSSSVKFQVFEIEQGQRLKTADQRHCRRDRNQAEVARNRRRWRGPG